MRWITILSTILVSNLITSSLLSQAKELTNLESLIIQEREALDKDTDQALTSLLSKIYDDHQSNAPNQGWEDIPFEQLAKGLIDYMHTEGIELRKKPEVNIHEYLREWREEILQREMQKHCDSLMAQLSPSYAQYLDLVKNEADLLSKWHPKARETMAFANMCHLIEANPDQLLLIGSFNPIELIDQIFTEVEKPETNHSKSMEPDSVEDLLQTFMSVNDAYEVMGVDVKSQDERQKFEDIGGYALIIGELSPNKCSSGYINSVGSILSEYGKYLHLGAYLLQRIKQQASLCGKELDSAVAKTLARSDRDYITVLDRLTHLLEARSKSTAQKLPLYIEIPDEVFMDTVIDYLKEEDELRHLHDLEGENLLTSLSEEDQEEIFRLLGKPSIEIVQRLEALLIFFFDLVALINNLGLETSQLVTKSTLDIMTRVNLSEKILTFSD